MKVLATRASDNDYPLVVGLLGELLSAACVAYSAGVHHVEGPRDMPKLLICSGIQRTSTV